MISRSGYQLSRKLAQVLLRPFVRLQVLGDDPTRAGGPLLLAPNHISHFDPIVISVAARGLIDWMAMAELFQNPFLARWCHWGNAFPVDRSKVDPAAARAALAKLRRGRAVGIFPEGGIRDGARSVLEGGSIRRGIGALAHLSMAPIVPTVILGSDRLYAWSAWRGRRHTPVWIGFGEPLRCTGSSKAERQACEDTLRQAMRDLAAEMRAHFRLQDEDFPQPPRRRKGRDAS